RTARERYEADAAALQEAAERRSSPGDAAQAAAYRAQDTARKLDAQLAHYGYADAAEARAVLAMLGKKGQMAAELEQYRESRKQLAAQIGHLLEVLQGRRVDDEAWQAGLDRLAGAKEANEAAIQAAAKADREVEELERKHARWSRLEEERVQQQELSGRLSKLQSVFRGNAFVEYVAEEQLIQVCRAASERLGYLTKRRYALEVDSGGGFVIRDDAN